MVEVYKTVLFVIARSVVGLLKLGQQATTYYVPPSYNNHDTRNRRPAKSAAITRSLPSTAIIIVYRSSVLIKVASQSCAPISLIRAHISPLDGSHVLPAAFSGPIVLGTLVQRPQRQAELSPHPTYSVAVMFWPVQAAQLSHAALPLCHL